MHSFWVWARAGTVIFTHVQCTGRLLWSGIVVECMAARVQVLLLLHADSGTAPRTRRTGWATGRRPSTTGGATASTSRWRTPSALCRCAHGPLTANTACSRPTVIHIACSPINARQPSDSPESDAPLARERAVLLRCCAACNETMSTWPSACRTSGTGQRTTWRRTCGRGRRAMPQRRLATSPQTHRMCSHPAEAGRGIASGSRKGSEVF
jgi:hypothetical protein